MQRQELHAHIPTSSSQERRMFKELMNKDKTVVYTGEVALLLKDSDEDSREDGAGDDAPNKRTEYALSG